MDPVIRAHVSLSESLRVLLSGLKRGTRIPHISQRECHAK